MKTQLNKINTIIDSAIEQGVDINCIEISESDYEKLYEELEKSLAYVLKSDEIGDNPINRRDIFICGVMIIPKYKER